jgi:hypothetical protein
MSVDPEWLEHISLIGVQNPGYPLATSELPEGTEVFLILGPHNTRFCLNWGPEHGPAAFFQAAGQYSWLPVDEADSTGRAVSAAQTIAEVRAHIEALGYSVREVLLLFQVNHPGKEAPFQLDGVTVVRYTVYPYEGYWWVGETEKWMPAKKK